MAPQSREVEHLEGKVITKCLNQKETAAKFVSRVQTELQKDDDATVGRGTASLEAPEEIKTWAVHFEGLKRNQAVIINEDGSKSDTIGAKDLEKALSESQNAQGLVFAGKVSDRIFELASKQKPKSSANQLLKLRKHLGRTLTVITITNNGFNIIGSLILGVYGALIINSSFGFSLIILTQSLSTIIF